MSDDYLATMQTKKKSRKRIRRSDKNNTSKTSTENCTNKREYSIYTALQNLYYMVPGLDECGKTTKLQKMRGVVQYTSFLETTLENLGRENELKLNFDYKFVNQDNAPSTKILKDDKSMEQTMPKSIARTRAFTFRTPPASSSQASATQTSASRTPIASTSQTPLHLSPASSSLSLLDLPDYLSDDANPFIDSKNDRWLVENYEPEIETTILSQSASSDIMKL